MSHTNKTRVLLVLAVVLLAIRGAATAAEQAGHLRAGVAKTDITPAKPVTMSGYAAREDLSQGIHDPLSARAIAFEQDAKRLVLLSCDLIGVRGETADNVRKAVLESCQLQSSDLFLTAIHTHGAPSLALDANRGHANNVEYTKTLEPKLIEVVKEAVAKLAPVQISYGAGSSPVGVNRRETVLDSSGRPQVVLGRNPAGPTDPEVQVLNVLRAETDERLAVVFAYATHSTALGPGNLQITGDIHGMAEQFLEKHFGKGVVAPAFAGASGNIDPWVRVLPKFETADGWIPEPVLMSTMLAEEVATVSKRIGNYTSNAPINTAMKTVTLPGKARERAGDAPAEATPVPLTITVARLGQVAFVGLGAEVFSEIGLAIKKASPFQHTVIITHCNGGSGYLPNSSAYDSGGYEVQGSRFARGAAEQAIEEAVRMLREL